MIKFIFALILLFIPLLASAQTFEKTVLIAPPKENENRYFYVPFDVPAGAKSVSVNYEYDKANGSNVLDLGVFDSRFSKDKSDLTGFRGWSGGRRNTIFISENEATNGYTAGKLPSGQWRVILGLYKVAPAGVNVTIKVKINEIEASARQQLTEERAVVFDFPKSERIAPPNANGYTWFRGDLHAHTFHSDGNWTIKGILDYAQANNLDFVGITEHNTFSHHAEIDSLAVNYKNLLVLRGEEVTTYGGHFNVWGLPRNELIDFRVAPNDARRLQTVVDRVRKLGLTASLNHPTARCGGCDWSYGDWQKMDSVEIWNGGWDAEDEAALKHWDELLQKGIRLTAIGSSDSHTPPLGANPPPNARPIGFPTNHVGMKNLKQQDLLEAIRRGRVWIGGLPTDFNLEFSALNAGKRLNIGETAPVSDKTIRLDCKAKNFPGGASISLISNGQVLQTDKIENAEYVLAKTFNVEKDSYFRLEVRSETGAMLTLTNPIYIQIKK
ncbi:MAG: CehA/McbA family metallohydrolase [Acidobacteria bacterium]|nr:CehA/McbA family metallohydrolase [Acidobacteriota bacterium]